MKTVYLIHGKLRTGKDTLAKMIYELNEAKGITTEIKSFALLFKKDSVETFKPLYDATNSMIESLPDGEVKDIVSKILYTEPKNFFDEKNLLTRKIIEIVGSDLRESMIDFMSKLIPDVNEYRTTFWANILASEIFNSDKECFIISDYRFDHEIIPFNTNDYKVITIKIKRNQTLESESTHKSNNGIDDYKFDFVYDNNGTLDELREFAKVVSYFNDIVK